MSLFQVPTAVRALEPAATVTDPDLLVVTPVLAPVSEALVLAVLDPVSVEQVPEAPDPVSVVLEPVAQDPDSVALDLVSVELVLAVVAQELVASEVPPPASTSPPTLEAGDPDQETSTPRLDTDTKMDTIVVMNGGDDCANVEQELRKKYL